MTESSGPTPTAVEPSVPEPSGRAPSAAEPVVRVEGVGREYGRGSRRVRALWDVSFTVAPGELVAIRGRSGAGKTTLLNIVGGLDRPSVGRVFVAGHEITAADERTLVELRRTTIGFVFQSFGLLPILSAAENVSVPLRLSRVDPAERERRVALLLATHDATLLDVADRVITLRDGRIVGDERTRPA